MRRKHKLQLRTFRAATEKKSKTIYPSIVQRPTVVNMRYLKKNRIGPSEIGLNENAENDIFSKLRFRLGQLNSWNLTWRLCWHLKNVFCGVLLNSDSDTVINEIHAKKITRWQNNCIDVIVSVIRISWRRMHIVLIALNIAHPQKIAEITLFLSPKRS